MKCIRSQPKIHNLKFAIFMAIREGNFRKLRKLHKLLLYYLYRALYFDYNIKITKNVQIQLNTQIEFEVKSIMNFFSNSSTVNNQYQLILILSLVPCYKLNLINYAYYQQKRLIYLIKSTAMTQKWLNIVKIHSMKKNYSLSLIQLTNFNGQPLIDKELILEKLPLFKIFTRKLLLLDLINFLKKHLSILTSNCLFHEYDTLVCFNLKKIDRYRFFSLVNSWNRKKGYIFNFRAKSIPLFFGFQFIDLDFNFQFDTSKWNITLTNSSLQRFIYFLNLKWKISRGKPLKYVFYIFNPIIRKWSFHYRKYLDQGEFKKLDHWMILKSWHYFKSIHSTKSTTWIYNRYYKTQRNLHYSSKRFYLFYDNTSNLFLYSFIWFYYKNG